MTIKSSGWSVFSLQQDISAVTLFVEYIVLLASVMSEDSLASKGSGVLCLVEPQYFFP